MKNLFLAMVAVLFLTNCTKESTQNNNEVLSQVKSAKLLEASNDLTFKLLKVTDSLTAGHNAFISPLSIQQALSMTLNGANGQTWNDMASALAFKNATQTEINDYNKSLVNALLNADQQVILEIANSIWIRENFQVEQKFIEENKDFYNAEVKIADFADPHTLGMINDWCKNKTHDKIPNVLDEIPGDAIMYLINALYFKGTWQYAFDKTKTIQTSFYKEDGSTISHEQMALQTSLDCYISDNYTLVALPYGDGIFNLVLLLPGYNKTVSNICASLNSSSWKDAVGKMKKQKVVVKMPKFKFEYSSLLNSTLESLGMGIAFSDIADFSKIHQEGGISISRVIHKTFVDVNEEGTEAAAVTVVEFVTTESRDGEHPLMLIADHPFMYFITEKSTGAVVFAGKMLNPSEKEFSLE